MSRPCSRVERNCGYRVKGAETWLQRPRSMQLRSHQQAVLPDCLSGEGQSHQEEHVRALVTFYASIPLSNVLNF